MVEFCCHLGSMFFLSRRWHWDLYDVVVLESCYIHGHPENLKKIRKAVKVWKYVHISYRRIKESYFKIVVIFLQTCHGNRRTLEFPSKNRDKPLPKTWYVSKNYTTMYFLTYAEKGNMSLCKFRTFFSFAYLDTGKLWNIMSEMKNLTRRLLECYL